MENKAAQMDKVYNPQAIEGELYKEWEETGAFVAHREEGKKPFTIVMPPPNITGQLHMGHAMDGVLQDSLTRYHRMKGDPTLWLPGTDHASIATEVKIVEAMRKEGLDKHDVGREEFLRRAWAWKNEYGGRIVRQTRRMGNSCDWSRERFTMDEGCSKAVTEVFNNLYEKGLIYRGNRMVNWCPCCNTSISDAEVEYQEQEGHFWHLLYTVKETGEQLELATTRPETMLGDTAVAINENDPRYAHLHGCHVILPLMNIEIPIVCDEHADMEKGTGVVKITPAHDPNDFEVGQRHNLPIVRVFTYDGHMTGAKEKAENDALFASGKATVGEPRVIDCGKYAGMTTMEARKAIVKDLEAGGYLKSVEPLKHEVGTCYRCHTTIEPMVSKQWFVKMEPLAKPAIECVKNGEVRFVPERFAKNYMTWMENIRDWCISRQLWWGHRIPAWYCDDCGEVIVARETPTVCPKCGCTHLTQDEDVLDTWFSSALWPFSTLGWPDNTEELKYFYPTNTLVTGYDIIFFWVARMIFSGLEHMGEVPFNTVFFHGLIRDAQGRKMSKSLGNGVDPLDVISVYGADALRFTLVTGNSPGNDLRFSEEKVSASRNFANKIWNAARFILMNIEGKDIDCALPKKLYTSDKWILNRFNNVTAAVTENLEKFELGMAVSKLYDFIWDDFCDWYIELAKIRMNGADEESADSARRVLVWTMSNTLKLLHPFMPYITEEIWQTLPHDGEALIVAKWPEYDEALSFPQEAKNLENVMALIRAIRTRRNEMNVPPSKKAHIYIDTAHPAPYEEASEFIARLAYGSKVEIGTGFDVQGAVTAVTDDAKALLPMDDLVDKAAETARLNKELANAQKQLDTVKAKLANEKFTSKAPQNVIDGVKANGEKLEAKIKLILETLESYQ